MRVSEFPQFRCNRRIPLAPHFLAALERWHLDARRAVIDPPRARRVLLSGQHLVMDDHAEGEGARTDGEQKAGSRRDYWIIRSTPLWMHATLTNLPPGRGFHAVCRAHKRQLGLVGRLCDLPAIRRSDRAELHQGC